MNKDKHPSRAASAPSDGPTRPHAARPAASVLSADGAQGHTRFGHRFGDFAIEGPTPDAPQSAHGGGMSLPAPVLGKMERSFGHSFGDVRIHTGGEAEALGALAFAQGTDIHIRPGLYDPFGAPGQELLGHELTHVIQQKAGRVALPQGKGAPVNADPGLEAEAEALGAQAARGESAHVGGVASSRTARGGGSLAPIQGLYPAKNLPPIYASEEAQFMNTGERTKYLKTPEEQAAHQVSFANGQLSQGGTQMDTQGASSLARGALKAEDEQIAVMNASGQFFSADANAEIEKQKGVVGGPERFHHSSLLDGAAVSGAGTLKVTDGQLQNVSDKSGHYKPDGAMTYNMVSELDKQGAMMDTRPDESGHAVNKSASVTLSPKRDQGTSSEVTLRGEQYLQTGGNEKQIRNKIDLNQELAQRRAPTPAFDTSEPVDYKNVAPVAPEAHDYDLLPASGHHNDYDLLPVSGQHNDYDLLPASGHHDAPGDYNNVAPGDYNNVAPGDYNNVAPGDYNNVAPGDYNNVAPGDYNNVAPGDYNNVAPGDYNNVAVPTPQVAPSLRPQITEAQLARKGAPPLPPGDYNNVE